MHYIRDEQLKLIPKGLYCHEEDDMNRICPFWSFDENKQDQENGVCLLFGDKDWKSNSGFDLLWDQVKSCDYNL